MRTRLVGAATAAVLAAGALASTSVLGSSHREAPRIMLDPSADNTDVYAFVAPDAPGKLTVVSNWVPLQNPAGGPYFGKLDPEARVLRQDRQPATASRTSPTAGSSTTSSATQSSFLYAVPPVNSINDANLNFVQSYDLYSALDRGGSARSPRSGSRPTCRSRRTTSARRRCPTTRPSPRAR